MGRTIKREFLLAWIVLAIAACDDGDGDTEGADSTRPEEAGAGQDATAGPDQGFEPDGSEPTADGGSGDATPLDLVIEGLSAPVEVLFDDHSILHLRCQSDDDCFAAQGYFHAAHRFNQMDLARRVATGRISAIAGAAGDVVLDVDRFNRHMVATRDGGRLEEQFLAGTSDRTLAMLEAYSRGVNAWLADMRAGRNHAALPDEYTFALIATEGIEDWTPADSVATTLMLIDLLTNDSSREIFRGQVFGQAPEALAWDLFGLTTAIASPVSSSVPKAERGPSDEALRRLKTRLGKARSVLERALHNRPSPPQPTEGRGSNNWVVSPALSASDHALLANDPHLIMSNPGVWYAVNIDAKSSGGGSVHVAGFSLPGLPAVVIGQNEEIAWGFTTTNFDMTDVYVETLSADGTAVIFNGEEVAFVEREFTFEVSGGEPVTEKFLYVPHHGPVLAIDREAGTALTLRWSAQEARTDLDYLLGLAQATDLEEARQAAENLSTIGQNVVVIDRQGGIGWFPYNYVPQRPWASADLPPWLPLPGDGSAEWGPPVPLAELPQLVNPESGYIATANNDMTGHLEDGDPTNDGQAAMQGFVAPGFRHRRIVKQLEAGAGQHTIETMQALMSDVHSEIGEAMLPPLLAAVPDNDEDLSESGRLALGALSGWDYTCPTGLAGPDPDSEPVADPDIAAASIGCAVFHGLLPRLSAATFQDELDAAGLADHPPSFSPLAMALARPEALRGGDYWDDVSTPEVETLADVARTALDQTGEWLTETLGPDVDAWRWGHLHTLTLRANLFDAAGLPTFNHGPFANDGGLYTVDVASPRSAWTDDYQQVWGASMRYACQAGSDAPVSCLFQMAGGQRHYRDSAHYDDLLRRYLVNDAIAFPFLPAEVDQAAIERLTIEPPP